MTLPSPPTTPPMKACGQCAADIPAAANLCRHCNSHQDWRRFLGFSNSILALLIALVSVISTSAPTFIQILHGQHSRVVLSTPVLRGQTLYLVASNSGKEPGVIGTAMLQSRLFDEPIEVTLSQPNDAFVPNGSRQVSFTITPRLTAVDALTLAGDDRILKSHPANLGTVIVQVRQSNDDIQYFNFDLHRGNMLRLLEAHARRCQDVDGKPKRSSDCRTAKDVIRELRVKGQTRK